MSTTDTPLSWTDAHRREAFVRLCELAAELRRADHPADAAWVAEHASRPERIMADGFAGVLFYLRDIGINGFDSARIETEVAIVRQRAEQTAAPPVIVGRYPTVDEVRAHAAACPCGDDGMGAWLVTWTGGDEPRPRIVTLGVSSCHPEWGVVVDDIECGESIEDAFCDTKAWRPLTAEGLPVVVGGDAEQSSDDLARALAALIGDVRVATPEATRKVLITRIDAALKGALRGNEMPELLRAVRVLIGGGPASVEMPAPVVAQVELTDAQKAALRICAMPFEPRGPWTQARDAMENKHGERWWMIAEGLAAMGLADGNGDLTDAGRAALADVDAAEAR